MNLRSLILLPLFVHAGMVFYCSRSPESSGPVFGEKPVTTRVTVYHFAVHPLHNPAKMIMAYQPLLDYLNNRISEVSFELEPSKDYGYFEKKYMSRKPEIILPNPWQTLQAMKSGYSVIAMAGDPRDFKGIFIVRKDSQIKTPKDLVGKAVSYPSPTALAACIMPQYYLYSHGINVNKEIINKYVGSQESSIMNAYQKHSVAGATWPPPWRAFQIEHPAQAEELRVIWETPSLINNSVMARNDIPVELSEKLRQLLVELHKTAEGKEILKGMETLRFYSADNKHYDIVRQYVFRFEKVVRPVEQGK